MAVMGIWAGQTGIYKITIRAPRGSSVMSSDPEQPYDNVKLAFSEGTWSLCCLFQSQHRAFME